MALTLRDTLSIFKLRISATIALSAVVGAAVASGEPLSWWQFGALGLAVLAASASAGAFNQIYERDLDRRMVRTRARPFATGAQRASVSWYGVIALLLVVPSALAWYLFNVVAAIYLAAGALVYGVVYTVWLKQRSWLNIVVGGLSGSFAIMAGAAAVDPALGAIPVALAVVLFLWTPPHFWSLALALRDDYARARIPMLPVVVGPRTAAWVILVHAVLVVLGSLIPLGFGMGWAYGIGAAGGGAYFIGSCARLVAAPNSGNAMRAFFSSLAQLTLLYLGALIDIARVASLSPG